MATTMKVSGFSSGALAYKIVNYNNDTPVATIQENVTGSSGTWISCSITNSAGSKVYVKLYDGIAPVLGTTAPTWVLMCPAQASIKVEVPGGAFFSDSLNLWTTRHPITTDSTVPAGTVVVTILCS